MSIKRFLLSSLLALGSISVIYHLIQLYFRHQRKRLRSQRGNKINHDTSPNQQKSSSLHSSSESSTLKSSHEKSLSETFTTPPHRSAQILIHSSLWDKLNGKSQYNQLNQYIDELRDVFPYVKAENTPLHAFDSLYHFDFERRVKYLIIGPQNALCFNDNAVFSHGRTLDASMIVIVPNDTKLKEVSQEEITGTAQNESIDMLVVHEERFEQLVDSLAALLVVGTRYTSDDVAQQMNLRFTSDAKDDPVCVSFTGDGQAKSYAFLEPRVANYWTE